MYASPLAINQGTICSGFIDGETRCKHGHIQTPRCNPSVSPFSHEWSPKKGPVCVIGDEIQDRHFHRTGG